MREDLNAAANKEEWVACLENGKKILKFEKEVDNVQLDVYRVTW